MTHSSGGAAVPLLRCDKSLACKHFKFGINFILQRENQIGNKVHGGRRERCSRVNKSVSGRCLIRTAS